MWNSNDFSESYKLKTSRRKVYYKVYYNMIIYNT